jgi:hypothetical protein
MKKLIILLIIVSLLGCNFVYSKTKDIDESTPFDRYSLTQYTHDYIMWKILRRYTSMLSYAKDDTQYAYDRYLQWKPSSTDLSNKEQFCHWNTQCINEQYFPAIKWNTYIRETYDIPFYTSAIRIFQNKVNTINNKAKDLDYISVNYGNTIFDWIIKNRTTLDKAFDRYITKERNTISVWGYSIIQDNSYVSKTINSYYVYIYYIGWKKLEDMKSKVRSDLDKAKIEYFQYRLLTDDRLYIKK